MPLPFCVIRGIGACMAGAFAAGGEVQPRHQGGRCTGGMGASTAGRGRAIHGRDRGIAGSRSGLMRCVRGIGRGA